MEISQPGRVRRFLLDRGLLALYGVFIAGYFLLPMASGHRRVYYLLVFPATLVLARELAGFYRGNRLGLLVHIYAGWMMLTIAWTASYIPLAAINQLLLTLMLLSFVGISGYLWANYQAALATWLERLVWLAAAAALVSIVVWYSQNPFPTSRLEPLGVMHHQNKSGAAYGLFMLLALQLWHSSIDAGRRRLYLALALVLGSLVLFTQSRTALAAVFMGLLVLLGRRALLVVVAGAIVSWILLALNPGDWWHRVEEFSFRPGIWRQVLSDMSGHWLIGRGYLVDPHVTAYGLEFNHAHNSYLASLRDGGLVGLGLLLAILGTALAWALKIQRAQGERIYLALLLYGMTCIFMDFDRLLVQPKEMWLYFWLPIALIMATAPRIGDPDFKAFPGATRAQVA